MTISLQLYEEVRKSLEQCDIQEDIEHFINLRRTGDKPPGDTHSAQTYFVERYGEHGWSLIIQLHINDSNNLASDWSTAPVPYENFYSNQRTVPNRQPPSISWYVSVTSVIKPFSFLHMNNE